MIGGDKLKIINRKVVSKATGKVGYIVSTSLDQLSISFESGERVAVYLYNYKDLIEVDPDLEKYLDYKLLMYLVC